MGAVRAINAAAFGQPAEAKIVDSRALTIAWGDILNVNPLQDQGNN